MCQIAVEVKGFAEDFKRAIGVEALDFAEWKQVVSYGRFVHAISVMTVITSMYK